MRPEVVSLCAVVDTNVMIERRAATLFDRIVFFGLPPDNKFAACCQTVLLENLQENPIVAEVTWPCFLSQHLTDLAQDLAHPTQNALCQQGHGQTQHLNCNRSHLAEINLYHG